MAKKNRTKDKFEFSWATVRFPLACLTFFLTIAIWRYIATGYAFYFIIFGYIGLSIAVGTFLAKGFPKKQKPWGRRVAQILVGLFMLGFLGFLGHENMQIEGFLFYLIAGIFHGALLHYFIAKLVGPAIFGRGWCGWCCWTMMVMDLFPFKRPNRPRVKYLGLLRYVHLALVVAAVFILYRFFAYGPEQHMHNQMYWLLIGNVAYYLFSVVLTIVLKDNRAFCKYICPIAIPMKVLSRVSLMKQQIDMQKCNDCGLCEKFCLMDIKLLDYARQGQRVLSSECILCNSCIYICPTNAITTTYRLDLGVREHINVA